MRRFQHGMDDIPFAPTVELVARLRVGDAALDLGYYDGLRRATQRDAADRLGRSAGTVGEHLQKIESRVFGAFRP